MLGHIHVTPADRILMQVGELLPEHVVPLDKLRMNALLPDLVLTALLVPLPVMRELIQQPLFVAFLRQLENLPRRVPFERPHHLAQLGNETHDLGTSRDLSAPIRAIRGYPRASPGPGYLAGEACLPPQPRTPPLVIGPLLPQVARNVQAALRFGSVVITMPPGCGVEPELCHFLWSTVKALQAEGLCGARRGG